MTLDKHRIRQRVRRTLYRLICINFACSLVLAACYPFFTRNIVSFMSWGFIAMAGVSNTAHLYLAVSLAFFAGVYVKGAGRWLVTAAALMLGLCQLLLLSDLFIYRLFKFHINGMVLTLLFTEGTGDSIHLSLMTQAAIAVMVCGVLAGEVLLGCRLHHRFGDRPLSRKPMVWCLAAVFFMVLADKATYAVGDLFNQRSVTRFSQVYPLYQPLTIKRFMRKKFGYEPAPAALEGMDLVNSGLNYPHEPIRRDPSGFNMNILWILVDAMRFDMVTPELTPNIHDFSETALRFRQHYSGGNCTRFGVFSLFYGLNGYYWHRMLEERNGPVLVDTLKTAGYDIRIITSVTSSNPEFNKTCFVNVKDRIYDDHPGPDAVTKDPAATDNLISWLKNRDSTAPFFGFLFYDAPHGPYAYPDAFEIDTPAERTPNYLTLGKADAGRLKNGYRNAVRFSDHEVGRVLEALRSEGLMESTVIVISADHGEEFYEAGHLGHNSAFTRFQTHVPFLMRMPGQPAGDVDRLTSHLDVAPTFMALLGVTNAPETYAQGTSLLSGAARTYAEVASWDDYGLIYPDHLFVFSLASYKPGALATYDSDYRVIEDDRAFVNQCMGDISAVFSGLNRFRF